MSHQAPPPTILDSSRKWLLLLPGVVTLLWILIEPAFDGPRSRPLPEHVRKLRRIDLALATYHHRYGSLPYDPRGPDHALYRLHGLVDAAQFDLTSEDAAVPAFWDHQHQRLQGGNVGYLNQPGLEPYATGEKWYGNVWVEDARRSAGVTD